MAWEGLPWVRTVSRVCTAGNKKLGMLRVRSGEGWA